MPGDLRGQHKLIICTLAITFSIRDAYFRLSCSPGFSLISPLMLHVCLTIWKFGVSTCSAASNRPSDACSSLVHAIAPLDDTGGNRNRQA